MDSCGTNSVFEIFTGEDKTLSMKVIYAGSLDPLDLTDCTAVAVNLPNADGTTSTLTLTSGVSIGSPAVLGKITVSISAAVSTLLNVGALQNIDVSFTIGGLVTVVQFFQALTVLEG